MNSIKLNLSVTVDDGIAGILPDEEMHDVVVAVLAHEGVGRPCELSVSLVSDEEITRLNAEWRGVDRATDVLSFECERPADPDLAEGEPCELGDIVLAPGFLRRQAARMGTTEADEARLMLVHGTLHLLGFDHMEPDEARDMQGREDDVLSSIPTDGTLTDVVLADHRSEEEA